MATKSHSSLPVINFMLTTLIWSVDVVAQIPMRLMEGDIITMGTTELMVHVTDLEDIENSPPEVA